jgi:large subunit ribosomal protein L29
MAKIVALNEMSNKKLEEMLENAREEMFNLRFQRASARLEDYSRIRQVRREVAQVQTVLRLRQLAIEAAAVEPEMASALSGNTWQATASFDYEESRWRVEFTDEDNSLLGSALVDLNKKRPQGRRARQEKPQPRLVTSYEVAR